MSAFAEANGDGDAAGESAEVHVVDDWALVVRADGAVEARTHWPNGDPKTFTTAPAAEAPDSSATYRYDLSIEDVLAWYTEETRFERDLNKGENGATFREGVIEAQCEIAPATFPDGSDDQPVGVIYTNAPTGPSTSIVAEDTADRGNYATFYPFETTDGQ